MYSTTTDRPDLNALAISLRAHLDAGIGADRQAQQRPHALAKLLQQDHANALNLLSLEFSKVCDAYVGQRAAQWTMPYVTFHDALTQAGHTSESTRLQFGTDAYTWAAADRTMPERRNVVDFALLQGRMMAYSPRPRHAKAIVVQSQSRNFLVLLNQSFNRWSLHIREFWPDIRTVMERGHYCRLLSETSHRADLTPLDLVRLSTTASQYGDDLPGVDFPQRPHLATYLDGSLMAGDEEAGIGLRTGDFRDKGYVLSFKAGVDECPKVPHSLKGDLSDVEYVTQLMYSAIDHLHAKTANQPK